MSATLVQIICCPLTNELSRLNHSMEEKGLLPFAYSWSKWPWDISAMVEKNWGKRNFGLDSLKSMNRDMEEKGILLRELSCRTASELPTPELPYCRRAPPAGPASFGGSSAPGVHPPEQPESFGRSSAPGVHRQSCRTAAAASAADRWLRRRPDCHRSYGGIPAEKGIVLPELSCRAATEFPLPELLVHWSTKS